MSPDLRTPPEAPAFSVMDWIGVIVTLLMVLFLISWPWVFAPAYGEMFGAFGGVRPALTLLVLSSWPALVSALIAAGLMLLAALRRESFSLRRRRALVVAAFAVSLGAALLCLTGVYLPIHQLSSAIE